MILEQDLQKYNFLHKNLCVKFYSAANNYCTPIVCAYEKCAPSKWPVGPRKFSHYIVHYIFDGEGFCTVNNEKMRVETGSIFTITPNDTLTYSQNPQNPWLSIWFEINGTACASLFEQIGLPNHTFIQKVSDPDKFKYLFFDLIEDCETHKDENGFIALSHIYKIFHALMKEFHGLEKPKLVQNQLFEKIKNYIDLNFKDVTPNQVAKKFFISPQHLDRLFKREIQTTPSKYIMDLKLDMSINMILNGNLSISSIAEALGFSSPYYFSSVFKKRHSIAPTYYRKYRRYQETEHNTWTIDAEQTANDEASDATSQTTEEAPEE